MTLHILVDFQLERIARKKPEKTMQYVKHYRQRVSSCANHKNIILFSLELRRA
jgi:hypothetical protein